MTKEKPEKVGEDSEKARKAPEKVNTKNKHIPELVLVTRTPSQTDGEPDKIVRDTWKLLKDNLKAWQTAQKKDKNIEKDHSDYYNLESIEADYNEKYQAYQDALNAETGRKGRDAKTKQAKEAMSLAGKRYKELKNDGARGRFNKVNRRQNHDWIAGAQEVLEDWLYHQDVTKRVRRSRYLGSDERKKAEAERLKRRTSYKLDVSDSNNSQYDWLHSLLELYDSRNIGGRNYKQGLEDHLGNRIQRGGRHAATLPLVGPHELRLWTPTYRRRPVGLRPPEDDVDSNNLDETEPIRFELDEAAVEHERARIEKKLHPRTEDLMYTSHEERRQDEVRQYKDSRPNTSNVREVTTSSGTIIEDRWEQIRTEQGLFISARESSWDWLTSYDLLGPVKSGWFPQTSAVRDDPEDLIYPESGSEGDSQVDAPQASGDQPTDRHLRDPVGTTAESGEAGIEEGQPRLRKEKNARENEASKRGSASKPSGKTSASDKPANDETALGEPVGESRKDGHVTINYPYPAREFWRDSKPFILGERSFITTEWAEETTGRRERHTYAMSQHASPVNSPPRSPVVEEISDATIPMGFPETDTRAVALEPRSRRKNCLLNPNRCRAFWDHSLNECWIPYSEQPTRPEEPVKWPIQTIDAPKDVTEGGADGYVPTLGIPVYRSRLYDHYGLMFLNTPTDKTPARPQWPRIGIRVPYEPMTFEDLRLCREDEGAGGLEPEASKSVEPMDIPGTSNLEKIGKILAPDAHLRGVHEVRSMAVPIIAKPQRPWADLDDDYSGSDEESDDESDDEGDLFHESYIKGSFPGGMPAPALPPTGALETTAQDETAPASIAPEAAVPAADDQEGGDSGDL